MKTKKIYIYISWICLYIDKRMNSFFTLGFMQNNKKKIYNYLSNIKFIIIFLIKKKTKRYYLCIFLYLFLYSFIFSEGNFSLFYSFFFFCFNSIISFFTNGNKKQNVKRNYVWQSNAKLTLAVAKCRKTEDKSVYGRKQHQCLVFS